MPTGIEPHGHRGSRTPNAAPRPKEPCRSFWKSMHQNVCRLNLHQGRFRLPWTQASQRRFQLSLRKPIEAHLLFHSLFLCLNLSLVKFACPLRGMGEEGAFNTGPMDTGPRPKTYTFKPRKDMQQAFADYLAASGKSFNALAHEAFFKRMSRWQSLLIHMGKLVHFGGQIATECRQIRLLLQEQKFDQHEDLSNLLTRILEEIRLLRTEIINIKRRNP